MSQSTSPPSSIVETQPQSAAPPKETSRQILMRRIGVCVCWLVGLGYLARLLKTIASRLRVTLIWDDSYMFIRYADNILKHGTVSWNPQGPPTYGLTSLLYMGVVLPMRALFRHNAAVAIECSSLFCGALFLCLFAMLVFRSSNTAGWARTVIALVVLLPIAGRCYSLAGHFISGMDTMFALFYLCAYFLVFRHYERSPSRAGAVLLVVLGGMAFSARPDLLVYTATLPAALFLLAPARRRQTGRILLASGALVLVQMVAYAVYFHSPLPLPFYVKGFHHYGGFPYEGYRVVAAQELAHYLHDTWFLFVLIALGFRRPLREWTAMSLGLLVATVAALIYFRFFAVQIMHFDQRFYYPTLPGLAALASYSCGSFWKQVQAREVRFPAWPRPVLVAGGAVLGLALLPGVLCIPAASRVLVGKMHSPGFQTEAEYHAMLEPLWFALAPLSKLPDHLTIASTDVGIPSVLNPGKDIVDMAGLHETHFAHKPFRAQWLFDHYHPDWLYLPFSDYVQYNQDIASNAYFRTHYELYPAAKLHTLTGVALWKDSPYYAQMRDIIRRQPPPRPYVPASDTPIDLALLGRLKAHFH